MPNFKSCYWLTVYISASGPIRQNVPKDCPNYILKQSLNSTEHQFPFKMCEVLSQNKCSGDAPKYPENPCKWTISCHYILIINFKVPDAFPNTSLPNRPTETLHSLANSTNYTI